MTNLAFSKEIFHCSRGGQKSSSRFAFFFFFFLFGSLFTFWTPPSVCWLLWLYPALPVLNTKGDGVVTALVLCVRKN